MTTELVITQRVSAPPAEVYAAWLSPGGLSRWWWVHLGDTTYAVDGRVGGSYLIESAAAGIGVRGTFTNLVEPTLIELTWTWLEDAVLGPEEAVRVDLARHGTGTLVTVTHRVADPTGVEPYRQGWEHVLGNLERLHAGPQPQPSITLTQVVPARRQDTYAAWLDPERLATWWWPHQETTFQIDARRGGGFAIYSPRLGLGASGTYLELQESERIVMTWHWESGGPPAPEDVVTVIFADQEDTDEPSTVVTLVHEFAVPQADTSNPTDGWTAVLTSLAEHPGATGD